MWCQDYTVKKLNIDGACPNHRDREREHNRAKSKETTTSTGTEKESAIDKKGSETAGSAQVSSSGASSRA